MPKNKYGPKSSFKMKSSPNKFFSNINFEKTNLPTPQNLGTFNPGMGMGGGSSVSHAISLAMANLRNRRRNMNPQPQDWRNPRRSRRMRWW